MPTEADQQIAEMKDLLRQVVAVMDSPAYESQVVMAHIHGFRYNGPKINMKRIREILELPPREGEWGNNAITTSDIPAGNYR